jgi:hypothetical protein
MVSATRLYVEGGGDAKDLHVRCREAFTNLLNNAGFTGRMPRLFISGGRSDAFADFRAALAQWGELGYVAMLIDSEEPPADIEATWQHLYACDRWQRPDSAEDEQVLLMTTCMETWIVADRRALANHYGARLQANALPPLIDLEKRTRDEIQDQLAHATRNCSAAYAKGKRSFVILGKLDPATLEGYLPSFRRMRRILGQRL